MTNRDDNFEPGEVARPDLILQRLFPSYRIAREMDTLKADLRNMEPGPEETERIAETFRVLAREHRESVARKANGVDDEEVQPPKTLGDAMRAIGAYTESEGGNSMETGRARMRLFDLYYDWCATGRPEHERWDLSNG